MISFEEIRERIIQEEEQQQFAEQIFDEVAELVDQYANKHLVDVSDPKEPDSTTYIKYIHEGSHGN